MEIIPATPLHKKMQLKLNISFLATPLHKKMQLKLNTSTRARVSKSRLGNNHQPQQVPDRETEKIEIIRDRKARMGLVKPEPPNFEIGWKRTKHIPLEKRKGYVIIDFLEKLVGLMEREFGSAELVKAGEIVADRAREEAEVLRDEGKVEERTVIELLRVLKLMEMDLAMLKAVVKEETLNKSKRLQQACTGNSCC